MEHGTKCRPILWATQSTDCANLCFATNIYSISHKKVKVPYRTRTVLRANLERTSSVLRAYFERTNNRAAHAQFGSVRFDSVRCGAVRRGTVAVIRAFQHGIDPEPDRGPPNSAWRPFLSRCHNNFVDRVTIDTIPRGTGLEALRISHISLTHSSLFRKCKFKPHLSAPMGFRGQFSRF